MTRTVRSSTHTRPATINPTQRVISRCRTRTAASRSYVGIDVRVPILDDVVRCGPQLPHRLKTHGRNGKLMLRGLTMRWLPGEVAMHRRQGFSIPLDRMVSPAFHGMLSDRLQSGGGRIGGLMAGLDRGELLMCSIAGFLGPRDCPAVESMMRFALSFGPDDGGLHEDHLATLRHRLSNLELSVAGLRPMSRAEEKLWIVYKEEIYNFPELWCELETRGHCFRS